MRKKLKRKIVHRPERDRLLFQVLRLIRGETHAAVSRKSGISAQTIKLWRTNPNDGGTRFAQAWTMQQVAHAYGMDFRLIESSDDARRESVTIGTEATA